MQREFKRLFYDIETSPNIGFFWRSGFKISIPPENIIHERSIICICYKWENERKVYSLQWNRDQSDKQMIKRFSKVLSQADEAVGHNIDKFDMKWFNTRCLTNGLPSLGIIKTVDTLVIARRRFYFNSNRLDYIAKLLGYGGKNKTT